MPGAYAHITMVNELQANRNAWRPFLNSQLQ